MFDTKKTSLNCTVNGVYKPTKQLHKPTNWSARRDVHGATAAYYARHAGIGYDFLRLEQHGVDELMGNWWIC